MIKVKDPKQNQHCFCGILTVDSNEKEFTAGDYVFFKTSRDAHFVAEGTIIRHIKSLSVSEIDIIVENIINNIPSSWSVDKSKLRSDIYADLDHCRSEAKNQQVVEISEIDREATSPLTNELNLRTEFLFRDDSWLDKWDERVNALWIRIGRRFPCLP